MFNLVSLFVITALSLVQCRSGHIVNPKIDMDNTLTPIEPRRRGLEKFVRFDAAPPATTRYSPGGTVVTCIFMGSPLPTAVWMKNGVPISDFEEESNEIMSIYPESYARLTTKLVVPNGVNGDVITCVGIAGLKQISASTTLIVEDGVTDISMTSAPVLTAFYNNVIQPMGTSVTLPCRAFSPSEYNVIWMDNHDEIIYNNPRKRVLPSGDLHLSNLVWEDMGLYTCEVKNMHGEAADNTFLYPNKP